MKIIVINHYKGLTQKNTLCSIVNLQYDLKKQENNTYHMRRKPPINILNVAFDISNHVNYIFWHG